ncbi:C1 family peptidase [Bacillus thuringiensis]|uniref:C1 family peptidase n=1 Tax=Bacillus thuringiensis TaxID=1428 RepID=UPI00148318C9|nr:C1 family peptidase [Bacillus thuringiensis]
MEFERSLGALPSPKDKRTLLMSAILPAFGTPRNVDYTEQMTSVGNQRGDETCVGFSIVSIREYQEKKKHGEGGWKPLSPRYLFNECDKIDAFPTCPPLGQGRGTSIYAAMQVMFDKGVCEETFWPYVGCNPCEGNNCDIGTPKEGAEQNAQKYKIKAYARLDNIFTMKRSLVVNGPCIIGLRVYGNWHTQEVESTGKIPMPPDGADPLGIGGHALCVVGYDDDTQLFKVKNSWGKEWGEEGYGYVPYDYMEREWSEAWSVTDYIENPLGLVRAKETILDQLGENYIEN